MIKKRKIVYTILIAILLSIFILAYVYNAFIIGFAKHFITRYEFSRIKVEMEKANYCEEASDCAAVSVSCLPVVFYESPVMVNKKEADRIQKMIDKYPRNCGVPSYGIGTPKKGVIKCIENHCRRVFD